MRWTGHVMCMREIEISSYRSFVENPEEKRPLKIRTVEG
jgi:hypothetical protein